MTKGGKIQRSRSMGKQSLGGGKTNEMLLKYGRNMAKVVNQRGKK